jgi:hypothetical protein
MRVLLDESTPRKLRPFLKGHHAAEIHATVDAISVGGFFEIAMDRR